MAVTGDSGCGGGGREEWGFSGVCRRGGEVCVRPHYPADLVMTAGAQEERSSRG